MSERGSVNSLIFATTSTTCTTAMTRPITSPVPSPSLSPKRKSFFEDEHEYSMRLGKRRRMQAQTDIPLYRNFGNGLSVCNNTVTFRMDLEDVVEVLRRSFGEYDAVSTTDTIDVEELQDDVLEELLEGLKQQQTKELPELLLNYTDLRELIASELDLL